MSEMTPVQVEGALACDYAGETAVGLLDSLMDSMLLARPGRNTASVALDLRRLADGAAFVAQELEALVSGRFPDQGGPGEARPDYAAAAAARRADAG